MKAQVAASGTSLSFGAILALIFITLKLTHHIDWSWWWVLSPLWIPTAVILLIFGLFLVIAIAVSR